MPRYICSLFVFTCFTLVWQSCSKSPADELSHQYVIAQDELEKEVSAKHPLIQENVDLSVRKVDANTILAFVEKGGIRDHQMFLLQFESKIDDLSVVAFSDATIEYGKDYLAITSDHASERFQFGLEGSEYALRAGNSTPLKGIGLSWITDKPFWQETRSALKSNHHTDLIAGITCRCYTTTDISNKSCDAGGLGAGECSVEVGSTLPGAGTAKCTVRCASGYHACCRK